MNLEILTSFDGFKRFLKTIFFSAVTSETSELEVF